MALTTYIDKQPAEVIPIDVTFVDILPPGEVIQNTAQVLAWDSAGNDASDLLSNIEVNSPVLSATMSGGIDGEDYRVTFLAVTQNFAFEYDVYVQCRDE